MRSMQCKAAPKQAEEEEEADELDYNLSFPRADLNTVNGSSVGTKEPVVILFGWAGCLDRHLAKYSEVYNSLGCIALRCSASPFHLFVWPRGLRATVARLVRLLTELELHTHPLIVHSLSNGGAMLYWQLVQQLQQLQQIPTSHWNVCGAVFDSGPLAPRPLAVIPIVNYCFRDCALWYRCVMVAGFVLMALLAGAVWAAAGQRAVAHFVPHPWLFRRTVSPRHAWPELYLYSDSDRVTPFQDVEIYMECRRQTGATITAHRFTNSEHVLHLHRHRRPYIDAIATWLQKVLPPAAADQPTQPTDTV